MFFWQTLNMLLRVCAETLDDVKFVEKTQEMCGRRRRRRRTACEAHSFSNSHPESNASFTFSLKSLFITKQDRDRDTDAPPGVRTPQTLTELDLLAALRPSGVELNPKPQTIVL